MARPYRRTGSKFWYIAPMINGVQVPQSSGTTVYAQALQKLRDIQGQVARGVPLKPDTGKGSFGELLKLVVTDYKMKGRASLEDLERRIDKHIQPSIGHLMAKDVQADTISQYALSRKESGASNASINREFAVIKEGFPPGNSRWQNHRSTLHRDVARRKRADGILHRRSVSCLDSALLGATCRYPDRCVLHGLA